MASRCSGDLIPSGQRVPEFAESILRRFDRNSSGRLERDEWGELRGNPDEIDRNRDGVITREELQAMAMNFGRRSDSGGNPGAPASASSEGSGKPTASGDGSSGAQPRFVRFRRPHEKLPQGLPDWFVQRDKDEDGQIAMAEFAASWNDAVVAEFFRYDLDGDGIVTLANVWRRLAGKTGVAGGARRRRP